MITTLIRTSMICCALALAGCNGTIEDIAPKAEKRISERLVQEMRKKGMSPTSPIMVRVFKEENVLELWKQKSNGLYDLLASYDICKWSGKLGPKFTEGDRQAPEGFYTIRPHQMNPKSSYHLAFNIGYPNAYDAVNGRGGSHLMVHGACSSSGCYSMTDSGIEEIYAFAREAFRGGQTEFQFQAFPFRMTPANMARYRNDPNYSFWKMLKEGYDHFEITKVPPKVDVCERRYVFNHLTDGQARFSPAGACPTPTRPESLMSAFQSYQTNFETAFATASAASTPAPRPSIAGVKEAKLVADWSRRRARGERVPVEPPTLASDGSVVQSTDRTALIDSPAGRRTAEREAQEAARLAAAEEARRQAEAQEAARQAQASMEAAAAAKALEAANAPAEASAPAGNRALNRIRNLFGS